MLLTIKASRKIKANSTSLFTIIANPETWPNWSEKVIEVAYSQDLWIGIVKHQEQKLEFIGKIVKCEPPSQFKAEIIFPWKQQKLIMNISYDLISKNKYTLVRENIRFEQHFPILLVLFFKIMIILGKPQGKTSLERLESLIENNYSNSRDE